MNLTFCNVIVESEKGKDKFNMAKIRKCDRCGVSYHPFIEDNKHFNTVGLTNFDLEDNQMQSEQYFDLCPQCSEQLVDWLCLPSDKSEASKYFKVMRGL